jgi:phosphoribosyl 1,2-cyclic phosphodiesterase
VKITFWGVRGSIPAPGPETNRYGGNTSCVSIESKAGELVIVDMGTGLMRLGNELMSGPFGRGRGAATILLSHSHWDHIQGLGFFAPVFVPGTQFTLWGHARSASMLEGILEGQMNPNFSPIYTIKNLGASLDVCAVTPGQPFAIGSLTVTARPNPHGATTALAFRIEEAGRAFVYASDVGYADDGPTPEILELYRGASVLLHDTTYTPELQATRKNRGFSSYEDAASAAVASAVERLVMFHYDQDFTDDDIDSLRDACRAALDRRGGEAIQLVPAAEGTVIEL